MPARDLPDLNVWLALTDPDHQHHERAQRYWEAEAAPQLACCRITMLGLLRLLTHSKVMHGSPFTPEEAWLAYSSFLALPEVAFLSENPRLERQFVAWTDTATLRSSCTKTLALATACAKPRRISIVLHSS